MLTDKPEQTGLDSQSRAERDRIDLNDEIAGRDTGRIKRFLSQAFSLYGESKEHKEARKFQSMLELLLTQDPHYAALYEKVTKKLEKAKQAIDRALIEVNQRLDESVRMLQMLRASAATLDDGTRVFKSERDGQVYTEDGQRLSDAETDEIVFPDNAPSWEDYQAAQEAYETAQQQKADIEAYQRDVLDPITERLQDEDNPPSMEELEGFEERLDHEMPDIVTAQIVEMDTSVNTSSKTSASVAQEQIGDIQLDVPDLTVTFNQAHIDIPELDPIPAALPAQDRSPGS